MKNQLRFLSILGFIGILGFVTNNYGYFGFFGFFAFLGYRKILPDEMFKANVCRAAKNAFFASLALFPIVTIVGLFVNFATAYAFGFSINFSVEVLIFSLSLAYYEKRGA